MTLAARVKMTVDKAVSSYREESPQVVDNDDDLRMQVALACLDFAEATVYQCLQSPDLVGELYRDLVRIRSALKSRKRKP